MQDNELQEKVGKPFKKILFALFLVALLLAGACVGLLVASLIY